MPVFGKVSELKTSLGSTAKQSLSKDKQFVLFCSMLPLLYLKAPFYTFMSNILSSFSCSKIKLMCTLMALISSIPAA